MSDNVPNKRYIDFQKHQKIQIYNHNMLQTCFQILSYNFEVFWYIQSPTILVLLLPTCMDTGTGLKNAILSCFCPLDSELPFSHCVHFHVSNFQIFKFNFQYGLRDNQCGCRGGNRYVKGGFENWIEKAIN